MKAKNNKALFTSVPIYSRCKIKFIKYLLWVFHNKPVRVYPGYNCGLCGAWVEEEFKEDAYDLQYSWKYVTKLSEKEDWIWQMNGWGICKGKCKK